MIRVLVILTDTNIGGAGRAFLQYLSEIDKERFEIIAVLPKGAELIPYVREMGFTTVETKRCRDKTYETGAVGEYMRIIKKTSPDIVHTHSSLAARIAAYLCGVKSRVCTVHCIPSPPKWMKAFPFRRIGGFAGGVLSTDIITVCNAVAKSLEDTGTCSHKITVIPNGVLPVKRLTDRECREFRRSLGIGQNDFVGLVSARLEKCKGHSCLIEAARLIRDNCKSFRRVRLIFMGDGSERAELMRFCRELDVCDMIIFCGFAEDTAPYYNIADIVLNSSLTEAASLALCEGMSLGKPSVVTDVGGNPELVTDKENGIVVPAGDCRGFAREIVRLMNDKKLYEKLSYGANERFLSEFTAEAMTDKIMRLYGESLERNTKK